MRNPIKPSFLMLAAALASLSLHSSPAQASPSPGEVREALFEELSAALFGAEGATDRVALLSGCESKSDRSPVTLSLTRAEEHQDHRRNPGVIYVTGTPDGNPAHATESYGRITAAFGSISREYAQRDGRPTVRYTFLTSTSVGGRFSSGRLTFNTRIELDSRTGLLVAYSTEIERNFGAIIRFEKAWEPDYQCVGEGSRSTR